MRFVNIHFQNKQLLLHEVLIGPHYVMVPVPVGSVACLKQYLQITQKGGIYIDNMSWILNMPKASLLICHLEFTLGLGWRILLNLIKSCNYYHHRVIISTRDTDISSRDFVSRCIFCKYFAKMLFFSIHLHKWNKLSITDFKNRSTLQIFIQMFLKIYMFWLKGKKATVWCHAPKRVYTS